MARHDESATAPVLLVGAGRLGSALLRGWARTGAVDPAGMMIMEPEPGEEAIAAAARGARLNPAGDDLAAARIVVLALKPQVWRGAARGLAPHLGRDTAVVSVMAGVTLDDLSRAFDGRPVARAMPTTAVAIGQGAAAVAAQDEVARRAAHAVLDPIATTTDLDDEAMIDAAIGISGSAPGFFYAFVEALEAAGEAQGLPADASRRLARAAVTGAAALMAETGEAPAKLRADVTSAGGTTQAGLDVFGQEDALQRLVRDAVAAAARRATELGK